MGRELRKVPPNWEHPKVEYPNYQSGRMEERYQPLYDRPFAPAMREWFTKWESRESGERPDYCPNDYEGQYWDWEGPPPDPKYYRPDWKPKEMTWFQVYETVTEGTPVTPPFATREELVDYLVKNGDFWDQKRRAEGSSGMRCDPWTLKEAQLFVEDEYAPSIVVIDGHAMSGVQAAVELNAGKQKDGK